MMQGCVGRVVDTAKRAYKGVSGKQPLHSVTEGKSDHCNDAKARLEILHAFT
jgi:hypothetical protein